MSLVLRYLYVLFFCCGLHFSAFSQTTIVNPDSISVYITKIDQIQDSLPDFAIKLAEQTLAITSNSEEKATIYAILVNIYQRRSEFDKTIAFALLGLENTKTTKLQRRFCNDLGNAYTATASYKLAAKYLKEGLLLAKQEKDSTGIAQTYNNLGNIYEKTKQWNTALKYYLDALAICEQKKIRVGIKVLSNNLGNVYTNYLKDYDKAIAYYEKAIAITLETDSEEHTGFYLNNIANIYTAKGDYKKAISLRLKAAELATKIQDKETFRNTYGRLAKDYAAVNDYKNAYKYLDFYHDSLQKIFTETQSQVIAEMQAKYDNHKKEKEIELLNKENEVREHQLQQRNWLIVIILLGVASLVVVAVLLWRSNRQKRKVNQTLNLQNEAIKRQQMELQIKTQQTEELNIELNKSYEELQSTLDLLNRQHSELEKNQQELYHKNKDITDSIEYARNIQLALLPRHSDFQRLLPESFIFFRPRDIVSGDFYYITQLQDRRDKSEKIILAVADCTGHGVPGALLTMIGANQLNDLIIHEGFSAPNVILRRLNKNIQHILHQDTSKSTDGMDIAVVTLTCKNGVFTQLEFAGAMNPIYLVKVVENEADSPTELIEIKADKVPIGGVFADTQEEAQFTKHTINIDEWDVNHAYLYMCSDGIQDQFGGDKGRKLMVKRFKSLLEQTALLPITAQQFSVESYLADWQRHEEQVDDMLLIGVKIK
jgi:serine phosphatase RsbU (regulator of sigma subunit)